MSRVEAALTPYPVWMHSTSTSTLHAPLCELVHLDTRRYEIGTRYRELMICHFGCRSMVNNGRPRPMPQSWCAATRRTSGGLEAPGHTRLACHATRRGDTCGNNCRVFSPNWPLARSATPTVIALLPGFVCYMPHPWFVGNFPQNLRGSSATRVSQGCLDISHTACM